MRSVSDPRASLTDASRRQVCIMHRAGCSRTSVGHLLLWVGTVLFVLWPLLQLLGSLLSESLRWKSGCSFLILALALTCISVSTLLGVNVGSKSAAFGFIIVFVAAALEAPAAHRDFRHTRLYPVLIGVDIVLALAVAVLVLRYVPSSIKLLIRHGIRSYRDLSRKR
jgi:hypothetical protein